MSFFGDITAQVAKRWGYSKSPTMVSSPGFPDIAPDAKSSDYINAYRGWVYAVVKRTAEQQANVMYNLMKETGTDTLEVFGNPADDLLQRVNSDMTLRDLMLITNIHMYLAGEAFWALNRGENGLSEPSSIIPLPPDRMKVVPGKEGSGKIIEGYIYQKTGDKPGDIKLSADEVIFFKEPDPANPFRGLGMVKAAARTIDIDNGAETYNEKLYKQGGLMNPAFETEQSLSEEEAKRLYSQIQGNWSGIEGSHKIMILQSGLKLSNGGRLTNREMEFLKGQTWTRDKIMSMVGATKIIMGITDDVNRASAEASRAVFAEYTIQPRVQKIADTLTEFYLPMFKGTNDMFYQIEDPVPVNSEKQIELIKGTVNTVITQNEARNMLNLPDIKGGDKIYVPNNLVPIDGKVQDEDDKKIESPAHKLIYGRKKDDEKKAKDKKKTEMKVAEKMTEIMLPVAEKILDKDKKTFRERAEAQGGFHDQMKKDAEKFTVDLRKALQEYFELQKNEVLDNIDLNFGKAATWAIKAPGDKFLFDKDIKEVGISLIAPILGNILEGRGNEAMFFIESAVGFNLDNPRARKFIELNALRLIKDIDATTTTELKRQFALGLKEGEGIPELKKRVLGVFDKADDARAEMIARTESIKAANFGAQEAWEQSGVVTAKEWLTAADERVEPLCAAMDGKIIGLGDDFFKKGDKLTAENDDGKQVSQTFNVDTPVPPLHPNCRCTLIPVMGSKAVASIERKKEGAVSQKQLDKLNKRLDGLNKEN